MSSSLKREETSANEKDFYENIQSLNLKTAKLESDEENETKIEDLVEDFKDGHENLQASHAQSSSFSQQINVLDPILNLSFECQEQIFHHLGCKQLLNLSIISKSWKAAIDHSPVVMKKTVFKYNVCSEYEFKESSKKLQNIKVKQEVMNQDSEFLSKVLKFYPTLRSLSFEGFFQEAGIEQFFDDLEVKYRQQQQLDATQSFILDHLTFIGGVENIDLILEKFSTFLAETSKVEGGINLPPKVFETITLSGVSKDTFSLVSKYLRAKKLVLNNMKLANLKVNDFQYQIFITKLEMSVTTIDERTLKTIIEICPNIKTLAISKKSWEMWRTKMKQLVADWSIEELRIQNVDDPVVRLPDELHDLIFQHLEHDELVKVSSVSSSWFNATADRVAENSMYILRSSMKRKRNYKSILTTVKNDLITLDYVVPFAPVLKEMFMVVEPASVQNVKFCFSLWKFEHLTLLNLASHEKTPLDDLRFPESLKILHLNNFKIQSNQPIKTPFVKYLSHASKLEDLSFFDCENLDNLFVTDAFPKVSLKLKTLRLPIKSRFTKGQVNFNKFLMTQKETLEELFLHKVNVRTINNIIKNFNLTSLGFLSILGKIDDFNPNNQTCESLTLLQLRFPSLTGLKPYLNLAPNLQVLHVETLKDDILLHVKKHFQFIEEIRYGKNKLKALKQEAISESFRNIKLEAQDLDFEEFDEMTNLSVADNVEV